MHKVQLPDFETDLSLFSAEQVKKAKLQEGESLRDIYESVNRASFTIKQLQQVIQTTWTINEQASQDGAPSLRTKLVATSFKSQISGS